MSGLEFLNEAPRRSIVAPDVRAAAAIDAMPAPAPAEIAGAGAGIAPIPAAALALDYDAEARDLVSFTCAMVLPLFPSLVAIYTLPVQDRIALAAAPLMRKYQFDLGKLGPELNFAIVVLPLAIPTVQAIAYDRAQSKKQNPGAAPAPIDSGAGAAIAPAGAPIDSGAGAGAVTVNNGDASPLGRFPGQA